MKTLLLMRHARSAWKHSDVPDHDRPLSKKGKKQAARMGSRIKDSGLCPQLILSSSAARSRQTADLFIETCEYHGDTYFSNDLYMAEMDAYLAYIHRVPDNVNCLLVIGHNPGLEGLLQVISDRVQALSPAAIAQVHIPISSWHEMKACHCGELLHLWKPKEKEDD